MAAPESGNGMPLATKAPPPSPATGAPVMGRAPRGLPGFLRRSLRNPEGQEGIMIGTPSPGSRARAMEALDEHEGTPPVPPLSSPSPKAPPRKVSTEGEEGEEKEDEDIKKAEMTSGEEEGVSPPPGTATTTTTTRGASPNSLSPSVSPLEKGKSKVETVAKEVLHKSAPVLGDSGSSSSTMNYRRKEYEKVINASVVNVKELRRLSWNGIPTEYRSQAWQLLLGYLPANSSRRSQTLQKRRMEYMDAIAQHYDIDDNSRTNQEQETLRQVLVDVPRTAPEVDLFRNARIRRCLTRLLYVWAMRHPASSYVQGINDLATPLIVVFLSGYVDDGKVSMVLDGTVMEDLSEDNLFEVEADTYWCLTNLLAGIQDHYTSDQPGIQRMVLKLEELVHRIDADLAGHLKNCGVEFMQFAFKWMNCLLLREFNLQSVLRLWDTYLSEEAAAFETFHVYVCAAFLCQFSGEMRTMEFDQLFGFMQNMPTSGWGETEIEVLLSQAFVLSTLFAGSDAHLVAQR